MARAIRLQISIFPVEWDFARASCPFERWMPKGTYAKNSYRLHCISKCMLLCLLSSRPSTGIVTSACINYSLSFFFHIFCKTDYAFLFLFPFYFLFSVFFLSLSFFFPLFFTPLKFNWLWMKLGRYFMYGGKKSNFVFKSTIANKYFLMVRWLHEIAFH